MLHAPSSSSGFRVQRNAEFVAEGRLVLDARILEDLLWEAYLAQIYLAAPVREVQREAEAEAPLYCDGPALP